MEQHTEEPLQEECVNVEHDEQAETAGDEAVEAITFVAADTTTKIIGDRTVPDDECGACKQD